LLFLSVNTHLLSFVISTGYLFTSSTTSLPLTPGYEPCIQLTLAICPRVETVPEIVTSCVVWRFAECVVDFMMVDAIVRCSLELVRFY